MYIYIFIDKVLVPPNSSSTKIELRSINAPSIFGNFTKVPTFTVSSWWKHAVLLSNKVETNSREETSCHAK